MTQRPRDAGLVAELTEERERLLLPGERGIVVALLLQDARDVAQAARAHQTVALGAEEPDALLQEAPRFVQVALAFLEDRQAVERGRHALTVAELAVDLERVAEELECVVVALRRGQHGRRKNRLGTRRGPRRRTRQREDCSQPLAALDELLA